jgi:aminoglycoside 6-adenylyltransferase
VKGLTADELERRFVEWASGRDDVRAAAVLGSRARRDRPADEWSDLDVVVVAREPALLLERADWIAELGSPRITFVEPTATGDGLERRVLYEDGVDVDFSIVSPDDVRRLGRDGDVEDVRRLGGDGDVDEVVRRGVRVLLDKDGDLAQLTEGAGRPATRPRPPSRDEFDELQNDFWYHAVWAAKKLKRGELFTAKAAVDSYMKRLLLRGLEWHAQALDPTTDTWHAGRFLEQWAEPRALDECGRPSPATTRTRSERRCRRRWTSSGG